VVQSVIESWSKALASGGLKLVHSRKHILTVTVRDHREHIVYRVGVWLRGVSWNGAVGVVEETPAARRPWGSAAACVCSRA